MPDGSAQLDISTLLIGLAVIIFSVSLAQLVILAVASYLKKKERRENRKDFQDESS